MTIGLRKDSGMKKDSELWRGFINGIAYSAATLIAIYNEGAAEQLIKESGISWGDLRKAKIDSYDRKFLLKIKHCFSRR